MTLIQTIPPTMRFMKMLANCRIFVFSDTLKKVSGYIVKCYSKTLLLCYILGMLFICINIKRMESLPDSSYVQIT